jgi:predicted RNA methylase
MLSHAGIEGHKVVEFAPGLGSTAKEILHHAPASYVGVDEDRKAAAIVDNIVAGTGLP